MRDASFVAAGQPMKIQEETPDANLLASFEEDYAEAVLHIAWNRDTSSEKNERTLLFAFVELLPTEIPAPIDDYAPKGHSCLHLGKHCVYVRHAVLTAKQALDWYLGCRLGKAVLPEDDGTLPSWNESKKRLHLMDMGEEPVWPALLATSDETALVPFCPQWIHYPRTHHLIPLTDFDFERLWTTKECELAESWLSGRLYFDLKKYPEYWGSVHLIAPNPVYRHEHSVFQKQQHPAESLVIRFEPRAGKSVAGLQLALQEKDEWGVTQSRRVAVVQPLVRVNFDRAINATSMDVWDERRGGLQTQNKAYWPNRSMSGRIDLVQTVRVQTPRDEYEVSRGIGWRLAMNLGERPALPSANTRLRAGQNARKKRQLAAQQGQQWFRGDNEEQARDLLRGLLYSTDSRVRIIDPYFGPHELFDFALAVGQSAITIEILTSAEVLRNVDAEGGVEKGVALRDAWQRIQDQTSSYAFEIRVMPGKKPMIHDRFFMIDDRIWLLGSSLNEFGSRGTMMLALPNPEAIRRDLEDAWQASPPLENWLQERRENQRNAAGQKANDTP